jgi:succinyl-CoA synthetase beta subunit
VSPCRRRLSATSSLSGAKACVVLARGPASWEAALTRLPEHQAKKLLRDAGIPVPAGRVAATPTEAREIAREIGRAVAVKAQVPASGRGKAGAIRFAQTPDEAGEIASDLLLSTVKGFRVRELLVEEKLDVVSEHYLGVVIDSSRNARCPLLLYATQGGVDIEAVPRDQIFTRLISPRDGFPVFDAVDLLLDAGVSGRSLIDLAQLATRLVDLHHALDCYTLEVNPVVFSADGALFVADCKLEVDNNSIFRHPELGIEIARDLNHDPTALDSAGWEIEKADLRGSGFVMSLPAEDAQVGLIGYHPIGGGSAMMGMDALNKFGLTPANYADTSGNPVASKIYRVAKVILSQPKIDGYLLAGFMMANQEQWHHAHALVKVLREILPTKPGLPCVLLLCGNKEEESLEILREGLEGVKGATRVEIYGREHVTDTDFIGSRLLTLVQSYQADRAGMGRSSA